MQSPQRNSATDQAGLDGADGAGRSDGSRSLASRVRDQRLLREVNDRIAGLVGWNETGVSLFVCECSDLSCAEALEISAAEYALLGADDSHFVVFPGHERADSERVVDRNGRYVVVAPERG